MEGEAGYVYNLLNHHSQVILVDEQPGEATEPHPHGFHPMFSPVVFRSVHPDEGSGNHESTTLKLAHIAIAISPDGKRIILN